MLTACQPMCYTLGMWNKISAFCGQGGCSLANNLYLNVFTHGPFPKSIWSAPTQCTGKEPSLSPMIWGKENVIAASKLCLIQVIALNYHHRFFNHISVSLLKEKKKELLDLGMILNTWEILTFSIVFLREILPIIFSLKEDSLKESPGYHI